MLNAEDASASHLALTVHGLSLSYRGKTVLAGADLEVAAGRSVAVMGPSGTGKSTLLSCILGLLRPDAGSVTVDGEPVSFGTSAGASRLRRERVGVVFQTGELLPELSPSENVALAGMLGGLRASDARQRAAELLSVLGVHDADRSVTEFSGGERQRVAVARALVNRPRLLLADEPTGSLDPVTRDQVVELLFSVPQQFGCALVVVTHDPAVAARADQRLELRDGVLTQYSTAAGAAT